MQLHGHCEIQHFIGSLIPAGLMSPCANMFLHPALILSLSPCTTMATKITFDVYDSHLWIVAGESLHLLYLGPMNMLFGTTSTDLWLLILGFELTFECVDVQSFLLSIFVTIQSLWIAMFTNRNDSFHEIKKEGCKGINFHYGGCHISQLLPTKF